MATFFHSAFTHKVEALLRQGRLKIIGSHVNICGLCPSFLMGQRFHAGRGKPRKPEATILTQHPAHKGKKSLYKKLSIVLSTTLWESDSKISLMRSFRVKKKNWTPKLNRAIEQSAGSYWSRRGGIIQRNSNSLAIKNTKVKESYTKTLPPLDDGAHAPDCTFSGAISEILHCSETHITKITQPNS